MNREYVIDFINTFINHDYCEIIITLKNGSTILMNTVTENIYFDTVTIEIESIFEGEYYIEFTYNSIKEIKVNGDLND